MSNSYANAGTSLCEPTDSSIVDDLDILRIAINSSRNSYKNTRLDLLLEKLERGGSKNETKETMIGIAQLYFDEQITGSNKTDNHKIQQDALEAVLNGLTYAVANQFRSNYNTDPQEIKKVLEMKEVLLRTIPIEGCRKRHMINCPEMLARSTKDAIPFLLEEGLDTIIPIASGGFEQGALMASYITNSKLFPMRYSHIRRKDPRVLLTHYTTQEQISQNIEGKKILLVDDIVSSGETGETTIQWAKKQGAARIYFISVNRSTCWGPDSLQQHRKSEYLYDSQGVKRKN